MGQILGTWKARDVKLQMDDPPTYDPAVGFPFARRERKKIVPQAHLVSARVPIKNRDYCAHYALDYQVCRYKHMPFVYRCHHEKHDYLNCQHRDYILRMKEFERERRLRVREQRIKEKGTKPKCDRYDDE